MAKSRKNGLPQLAAKRFQFVTHIGAGEEAGYRNLIGGWDAKNREAGVANPAVVSSQATPAGGVELLVAVDLTDTGIRAAIRLERTWGEMKRVYITAAAAWDAEDKQKGGPAGA